MKPAVEVFVNGDLEWTGCMACLEGLRRCRHKRRNAPGERLVISRVDPKRGLITFSEALTSIDWTPRVQSRRRRRRKLV